MALHDVVLELADEMDQEAQTLRDRDAHGDLAHDKLRDYAKQLRRAVKASAGERQTIRPADVGDAAAVFGLGFAEQLAKDRAERQARRLVQDTLVSQVDGDGLSAALLVGGPLDGDYVPIDPGLRAGMMPVYAESVYVYGEDKKLHYSELETLKYRRAKGLMAK